MTKAQRSTYLSLGRTKSGFHQDLACVEKDRVSVLPSRFAGEYATASGAVVSRSQLDHLANFADIPRIQL